MRAPRITGHRRLVLVVAIALGAGGFVGASATAETLTPEPRSYVAAATPTAVCAAPAPTRVEVDLTNTSTQQLLGSADVTVPAAVGIDRTAAERPTVTVTPAGGSSATVRLLGDVLQVRNASVGPGATVTVAFTVRPEAGEHQLTTVAKQANNFSGPPGNDLRLRSPQPTVTASPCELVRFVTQPADAETGQPVPGDGGVGTWPQVLVTGATGEPVAGAQVTVALAGGTAGASLSGTLAATTDAAGIATFADLRVGQTGEGYVLRASTSGSTAESDPFDVFDDRCEAGDRCTFTAGDPRTDQLTATATGTAGAVPGGLNVAVGPKLGESCAPPPELISELPSETTVVGSQLSDKTLVLRVDKAYDQQQTNNGVSFYQVCAQPDLPLTPASRFLDRYTGELVDVGEWGWLPDCTSPATSLCVLSRVKQGGDPLITVFWGSKATFR